MTATSDAADVIAELTYSIRTDEKPVTETFGPGDQGRRHTGAVEARPMPIRNGRPLADQLTLERNGVSYNPDHRWFYFPRMRRDEALVFKVYDSRRDGRARFTPHTLFLDPTTPAGAPPRQSIETRAFAFFDPA